MNKNLKNAAKSLLGILSAFLLVSVMAACAPKTTLAGDWADDGTFTVTADTARDDDMFMIGYEVEDGTTALTITPDLSKGTLHIALAAPLEVDASTEGEGADATVDDIIASTSFDFESGDNIFVVDAQGQPVDPKTQLHFTEPTKALYRDGRITCVVVREDGVWKPQPKRKKEKNHV